MGGYIERFIANNWVGEAVYAIFRIVVSLNFLQHGVQILFGFLGGIPGNGVHTFSLLWFAGTIEFSAGIFIALGIFTRFFSFVSAGEMAYAYFVVHAPHGFFPILNKGELALLFLVCFLVITILGSGRFGLEKYVFKREVF